MKIQETQAKLKTENESSKTDQGEQPALLQPPLTSIKIVQQKSAATSATKTVADLPKETKKDQPQKSGHAQQQSKQTKKKKSANKKATTKLKVTTNNATAVATKENVSKVASNSDPNEDSNDSNDDDNEDTESGTITLEHSNGFQALADVKTSASKSSSMTHWISLFLKLTIEHKKIMNNVKV